MGTASLIDQDKFISGKGEMASLIRAKDWSDTPLGEVGEWPLSLLTTLSIMLSSKFPMFLWWGPDLVCFYNDSYRPSLGNNGKHPNILGTPADVAWGEIWHIIKPQIDQVLSGGDSIWFEDQLIPIFRNGKLEDVYWTYSYSPVRDESGKISGVLVVCNETTDNILGNKKIAESEQKFRNLVSQAFIATAVFSGKDFVIELANDAALSLWGKNKEVIGKKLLDAMPELAGQQYISLLQNVYETGQTYEGRENLAWIEADGKLKPVYLNFTYKALRDGSGSIDGILTMGYEVTAMVVARNKAAEAEERTRLAVEAAMLGTFDIDVVTDAVYCSERFCEIFGFDHDNPTHQEFIDAIHPDDRPIRDKATKKVFETGSLNYEVRIIWPDGTIRWINAQGKLFFHEKLQPSRLLGTVKDITAEKNFLHTLQESEKKFRNTVKQAPAGIAILKGLDFIVEMANESYLQLVDKTEKDFVGKPLFVTLPEVREVVEPLLNDVLHTGKAYYATELTVMLNRYGKAEPGYFNLVYQPMKEPDGVISGIMVVATEVTSQVVAKNALLEREIQFRHVVTQSPIAIAIIKGRDMVIDLANPSLLKNIWRRELHEVEGKPLLEVFPELKGQEFPALLSQVFENGQMHHQNEAEALVDGPGGIKKYFLDFEYAPLFESDGSVSAVMITVNDVTEKVEARQQIKESAERLHLATEGTQLATWDLNLHTSSIIYSPRLAEIFGFAKTALLSRQQIKDRVHPDDNCLIVTRAFEEALQTGVYNYEARIVHDDNSTHWIRTQGKILFDENHTAFRMLGTVQDITERRLTSQVLEESEQKFRTLANSMPQFVWTGDKHGNLHYFNEAVYYYSGLNPEILQADGWLQIVHPDDREENVRQWIHSVQTGEPFLFEHRFRRHDGEYRWQLSRAIPQMDQHGELQMWVGTSTDIDDIKKHDQQKDDFIKMASHELKTPVTTIKGYVQLLLKTHGKGNDQFLAGSLSTIDKQVSKLAKLISDLLDLTKIETGSLQLHKEPFSIAEKVKEIIADIQATTSTHTMHFRSFAQPMVYADVNRIEQVVLNLMTNAIKYSPRSDKVNVEIRSDEKQVTVSVADFGIGIAPEEHLRVFERFYRVSGKDEKTFPGFGIGLSIVQEIIGLHDGRIWLESEKGRGCTFYFTLPVYNTKQDVAS